jgi:hypothetical protein
VAARPSARISLLAADTTRAVPITGAIATNIPSSCSSVSPAIFPTERFTS